MRLTVLGSNGTYPTPGRPASGYLLQHRGQNIWVDTGSGTFAMLQELIPFSGVEAVVVTHVHPDHCVDLLAFYHAIYYGRPRHSGIRVLAADLVAERLGALLSADGDHGFWEALAFTAVAPGDEAVVGDISLTFAQADHPVPTVAVRAEANGKVLTYSSDTGVDGEVQALAQDADLFLCEATYQGRGEDKPWPHHLTAAEAGDMARAAGVRRLMLTHLWPTLDPQRSIAEAEGAFGRPVALSVPGMEIAI
ncbi:MAG: MBL fold metallo-hydrolase [Actinomycetota bacterium]|nr:MBL fold metallo-hydrolase [Actinomycetota bacterium]